MSALAACNDKSDVSLAKQAVLQHLWSEAGEQLAGHIAVVHWWLDLPPEASIPLLTPSLVSPTLSFHTKTFLSKPYSGYCTCPRPAHRSVWGGRQVTQASTQMVVLVVHTLVY